MEKNCYKILNLNPGLVAVTYDNDPIEKVVRETNSRDKIVKEAYERRLIELTVEFEEALDILTKRIKNEIEILKYGRKANEANKNSEKIVQINENIKNKELELQISSRKLKDDFEEKKNEVIYAYNQLATEGLRSIYEKKQAFKTERPNLNGDNAYDFFAISEKNIYSLNAYEADKIITKTYDNTIKYYKNALSNPDLDDTRKKEIENYLTLADEYYNKIRNMDLRTKYKDELDKNEKAKKVELLEEFLREKFSKIDQYDPNLIQTYINKEMGAVKAIKYKETKNPITVHLPDLKNRNVRLTKKGEIMFKSSPDGIESYISEYQIKRTINGKEKLDKIYANLNLQQLEIDKQTKKPMDIEYYDCVVNDLLSEGVLRGAKYNKGYIGGVEKNENGQYQIILKNKELDFNEQKNLAAVMIYAEQQSSQKSNKEQERNGER